MTRWKYKYGIEESKFIGGMDEVMKGLIVRYVSDTLLLKNSMEVYAFALGQELWSFSRYLLTEC